MAAPSCVTTGHQIVDEYAAVEACIAVERARNLELDPLEILGLAKTSVEHNEERILELARRLAETGWVELADS